jgi:glutamyl-Q tRNA(Asp) synthetase
MYLGRFAPSPTGPLHAGSLATALASWLDARAHDGRWLVRIEDVDTPRCVPGADRLILRQLATCGLVPDAPPVWQSRRGARYQQALARLAAADLAYPCACSRHEIEAALARLGQPHERGHELVYPGTCRPERGGLAGRSARTWRFHTERFEQRSGLVADRRNESGAAAAAPILRWTDRRLGAQAQRLSTEVGDFVLRRADGPWAYQLAVVVDDAAHGVTHVVRGEDLAANTPRQIALQRALGLPTPVYLHTPLVHGADGEKLSKQNGARAVPLADPVAALTRAAEALGLPSSARSGTVAHALQALIPVWTARYGLGEP